MLSDADLEVACASPSPLVRQLAEELKRMRRGEFTAEELQLLCHNVSESDERSFKLGCEEYQRKLFGSGAAADENARVVSLLLGGGYRAAAQLVELESKPKLAATNVPTYAHLNSGGTYSVLGVAEDSTNGNEGQLYVVYVSHTYQGLRVRKAEEFYDGRFAGLERPKL